MFGTVVTRGPRSPLAAPAIAQLDIACELFEKASKLSRRAAKALVRSSMSAAGQMIPNRVCSFLAFSKKTEGEGTFQSHRCAERPDR